MLTFIIENNVLLYLMMPIYWLVCANLLKMGMDSHVLKISGLRPERYPNRYFFWMMVQVFALAIAGVARGDTFVMATRFPLLLCVIICYVMTKDKDGRFEWRVYGKKITATIVCTSLFFVAYSEFPGFGIWLKRHSEMLGYIAFSSMIAYLFLGEATTIRQSYLNLRAGKERMRGWHLLRFRIVGFVLQITHYRLKFGPYDPLFLMHVFALIGTGIIIVLYALTPPKKEILQGSQ